MRVLVLDHDRWRGHGIARVLDGIPEFTPVLESDLGDQTWSKSLARVILVSEDSMRNDPRSSPERLRAKFPDVRMLVVGEHNDPAVIAELLTRGADGYFSLQLGEEKLVKALRVLARGSMWMPEEAVVTMVEQLRTGATPTADSLNPAERTLLAMLDEGLTNKEIASRLGVAEITVKTRLARLYRRFGVRSRLQLLSYAMKNRLLSRA